MLTVAVSPDHRLCGLGRGLLAAAETELIASGIAQVHLEVAADNKAALALYEALDYQTTGVRKGYYKRPESAQMDAVMMVKRLST